MAPLGAIGAHMTPSKKEERSEAENTEKGEKEQTKNKHKTKTKKTIEDATGKHGCRSKM